MNGAEEIAGGFVIASGNAAVLLEPSEEVFDQMAGFVQMPVETALVLTRCARWNHDAFARLEQRFNHALLCIVGFVGNHGLCLGIFEQYVGPIEVVRPARG